MTHLYIGQRKIKKKSDIRTRKSGLGGFTDTHLAYP